MENPDTQRQRINIDLDKILDTGLRGVRRAYVFMGFGINSANDPNFKDFHLPVDSAYRLLPAEVSEEQLQEFKKAYSHWSVSSALRELIENYEVFLEELFFAASVIQSKGEFTQEDFKKFKKESEQFHSKSFPAKLKTLQNLDVEIPFTEPILSIKKARNCIGHRLGKVQSKDKMVVTWRGYDVFAQTKSGLQIDIMQQGKFADQEGVIIPEESDVMMKVCNRSKEFSWGQIVSFEPAELHEMGMMFIDSIQQTVASVLKSAKDSGIHNDPPSPA